jgi:hypothetical protein
MNYPEIDKQQELDRLSDVLRQKSGELDKLISANNELCDKLENDSDTDIVAVTHQRESVTQNLIKIENHIADVLSINQDLQENLNTEKVSMAAKEIGTSAALLFESFEKVVAILNDKQDKVTMDLASLETGFHSVKSYIGTSV